MAQQFPIPSFRPVPPVELLPLPTPAELSHLSRRGSLFARWTIPGFFPLRSLFPSNEDLFDMRNSAQSKSLLLFVSRIDIYSHAFAPSGPLTGFGQDIPLEPWADAPWHVPACLASRSSLLLFVLAYFSPVNGHPRAIDGGDPDKAILCLGCPAQDSLFSSLDTQVSITSVLRQQPFVALRESPPWLPAPSIERIEPLTLSRMI